MRGAWIIVGLVTVLWALPAASSDGKLSNPPPSWDVPRQIILQLTENDPEKANSILWNAVNLQKFYGADLVKLAIIAYGPGVRQFMAESSAVGERITSLQDFDIEFIACGNTLRAMHVEDSALVPGVTVVPAGIAEIVERRLEGWHHIAP